MSRLIAGKAAVWMINVGRRSQRHVGMNADLHTSFPIESSWEPTPLANADVSSRGGCKPTWRSLSSLSHPPLRLPQSLRSFAMTTFAHPQEPALRAILFCGSPFRATCRPEGRPTETSHGRTTWRSQCVQLTRCQRLFCSEKKMISDTDTSGIDLLHIAKIEE